MVNSINLLELFMNYLINFYNIIPIYVKLLHNILYLLLLDIPETLEQSWMFYDNN